MRFTGTEECILSALKVGLACSEETPRDKMKMEEAKPKLTQTRDKFLRAKLEKRGPSTDEFTNK